MLIWVIPLALFGIFAAAIPLYRAARTQILSDVRKQVDGFAAITALSLQGFFKQRLNDLDAVAESSLFRDYYKNKEYGLSEEAEAYRKDIAAYLLAFRGRTRAYESVRFFDASGRIVVDSTAGSVLAPPAADLFQRIKEQPMGGQFRSTIQPAAAGAYPHWDIGKPLYDDGERFRGAILMSCNLQEVEALLASHQAGEHGAAALVDSAGNVLAGSAGSQGPETLSGSQAILGTPWRVRTSALLEDFIGPLKRIRNLTVSVTLTCALVVMLLIFIQVRSLTAPIKDLTEASRRFGEGDLAHRVAIRGSDEIAELAQRFNAMAASLEERTGELESRLRQLSALKSLSDTVAHRLSREEIARVCLQAAAQGLSFDRGALYLTDADGGGQLRGCCVLNTQSMGLSDTMIRDERVPLGSNRILAWVARERKSVNIPDADADPRCTDPIIKKVRAEAFCAVPILVDDRVYGVIMVDRYESRQEITEEDVGALSLFCGAAGLAFKNLELFEGLRLSEARYRSVVDSSADAIIGLDADLRVAVWSIGARRIFGYAGEEMRGATIERLFAPGDYRRLLRHALEKGPLMNYEMRGRTSEGRALDLSLTWSGSGDGAEPQEWSLVVRDVTTEKAIHAHLVQTEKLSLTGQLLSGVAHELNNPLTNVIGYSEMLQQAPDAADLPTNMRQDLEEIALNAKRCAAIVDNLLLFVRKSRARKSALSLRTTVRETLHLLKYGLEKQEHIQVETDLEKGLPRVLGNLQQLEQVLLNIVQNACQAMRGQEAEKKIKISARHEGGKVLLEICDSGPGVSLADRKRILEPFFTTRDEGTGLGLAICARIIREHGSELECESSPLGGACFRMRLPVADKLAAREKPRRKAAPIRDQRVLVVDDEQAVLTLMERMLSAAGHRVDIARSGREALRRLQEARYDLVVTDLHLGGMEGRHVATAAMRSKPAPAVLLVTGDVTKHEFPPGHPLERLPVLAKPFTLERFRAAVDEVLLRGKAA
ncbi:MAG: ATP-binding protein [Elusimicrobiota bacterium]